jgi:hypothetical protein
MTRTRYFWYRVDLDGFRCGLRWIENAAVRGLVITQKMWLEYLFTSMLGENTKPSKDFPEELRSIGILCLALRVREGYYRNAVAQWGMRGARNLPRTIAELPSIIAEWIDESEISGIYWDGDIRMLIRDLLNTAFAPLRERLGLTGFNPPLWSFVVNDQVLSGMETAGLDEKYRMALRRRRDKRILECDLFSFLPQVIPDNPEQRDILKALLIPTKSLGHQALLAMEAKNEQVHVVLVDGGGDIVRILPEQLVSLVEYVGKTVVLIKGRESDSARRTAAVPEVLGFLDPARGCIRVVTANEKTDGGRITKPDHIKDRFEFYVHLDDVLAYYAVFRREMDERTEFQELRARAEATAGFDISQLPIA